MKSYRAPDGTNWGVDVQLPGSSNAMVVFRHPNSRTARLDRYNWIISRRPESLDVLARIEPREALSDLSELEIAALFRRSMPISTSRAPINRNA